MWQDNLELLHAYFSAADQILTRQGRQVHALDISTGPCLAPLMATMGCIDRVQLTDYDDSNRERITDSNIGYWGEYAKELVRLFPERGLAADVLLSRLDDLRHQTKPLDVDLRRAPVFLPDIVKPGSVELLTMHFVVDSICETAGECFELLGNALTFVTPDGWLILSALIESTGWTLGDTTQPSPNLTEKQIDDFMAAEGINVVSKTRSIRKPDQIYDGGWTVYLAQKG
jgi:hypothetical protein